MNAYYGQVGYKSSSSAAQRSSDRCFGEGFINLICNIIAIATCSAAIKIGKALLCTALFVSFFAVIGAIESTSISLVGGVFLCLLITLFESLMLKRLFKRTPEK